MRIAPLAHYSRYARYYAQIAVGKTVLRIQRVRMEQRSASRAPRSARLAPPLRISYRTRELVARHYLEGRHANLKRKVAWVTSGAPVELFKALDFFVLYPENHGALCGTARRAPELLDAAERGGYSQDLCSYARTDLGSVLSGKTPVGRLPKPDLLVACTNICQTVLFWYRLLADHFKVPLILIDTPFVYDEAGPHAVAYVQRQIEEAVPVAEQAAGRALDYARLREVTRRSKLATELWLEIINRGQRRPSPLSVFDEFVQMAPIVEMRGESFTVDFYAAMLAELDGRIAQGVGAVTDEKKRVLWDNLPIWYELRHLAEQLSERGIALVVSTYTNAWGELAPLIDPERPLESAARTYLHPILNRGTGHKLRTMTRMAQEFSLDGAILHSDRSCKPYSMGQMDQRDRLIHDYHLPALLLESDHNDPRAFAAESVANRLDAFAEMLGV